MHVIKVRNVNQALPEGLRLLEQYGVRKESRIGDVFMLQEPVTTVYQNPWERCVLWGARDFNPFFALLESWWMLAGRRDVEWLERFNSRMRQYSDDGISFSGAYGYRWRRHFSFDQIYEISNLLTHKPWSRRAVLQIWDAKVDLDSSESGLDKPCNVSVKFWIDGDKLNMQVDNRSNDIIYGKYYANAAHFSVLQEYMAARLGVAVGRYWHTTTNFHAYVDKFEEYRDLIKHAPDPFRTRSRCLYEQGLVKTFPLVKDITRFDDDLHAFEIEDDDHDYANPVFTEISLPMLRAHAHWRDKKDPERFTKALKIVDEMPDCDWHATALHWLKKRETQAKQKDQT